MWKLSLDVGKCVNCDKKKKNIYIWESQSLSLNENKSYTSCDAFMMLISNTQ
jgi:hypothetical protein